jgi:hypothetical protein
MVLCQISKAAKVTDKRSDHGAIPNDLARAAQRSLSIRTPAHKVTASVGVNGDQGRATLRSRQQLVERFHCLEGARCVVVV